MKSHTTGLVSIIVPTYDRGELFTHAINSLLMQTYKNLEVIIVDDFSSTPPDFNCFQTIKPIIYHRNYKNLGGAKSRNIGFDISNGEYICFLDDDDTYIPNKIEVLLKELEEDESLGAIFGKIIKKSQPSREIKRKYLNNNNIIKSLKGIGYLHTNTSLIRREVFEKIRFDEELDKFQDTQLHIELVNKFKCKYIPIPVAYWNDVHKSSQITDMNTKKQFIKSLENYKKLIESLTNSKSISFGYQFYMRLKLCYMKIMFYKKFKF